MQGGGGGFEHGSVLVQLGLQSADERVLLVQLCLQLVDELVALPQLLNLLLQSQLKVPQRPHRSKHRLSALPLQQLSQHW